MKFSVQEEYGLRFLIIIGKSSLENVGITIPEISKNEDIAEHSVAKILRLLRLGGILQSERGHTGGYTLAKDPAEINIGEVLNLLGGRLYDTDFCQTHTGLSNVCVHTSECATRPVWQLIQTAVDSVVFNITLAELLNTENSIYSKFYNLLTSKVSC